MRPVERLKHHGHIEAVLRQVPDHRCGTTRLFPTTCHNVRRHDGIVRFPAHRADAVGNGVGNAHPRHVHPILLRHSDGRGQHRLSARTECGLGDLLPVVGTNALRFRRALRVEADAIDVAHPGQEGGAEPG